MAMMTPLITQQKLKTKEKYMNPELLETIARVTKSITRIPDRLSTPVGESARAEFARIFSKCINAGMIDPEGLYLTLPFQASLLTDPVMYTADGDIFVLDHPTKPEQGEFAMNNAHIIKLHPNNSLYQNRYPRLIYIPTERKEPAVSIGQRVNRLRRFEFHGPFAKGVL
jgi:hypothetical protein